MFQATFARRLGFERLGIVEVEFASGLSQDGTDYVEAPRLADRNVRRRRKAFESREASVLFNNRFQLGGRDLSVFEVPPEISESHNKFKILEVFLEEFLRELLAPFPRWENSIGRCIVENALTNVIIPRV